MKDSELIQTLNKNANKTPDQIVTALRHPFDQWRLGKHITPEEYAEYGNLPVVLLYFAYHDRPSRVDASRCSLNNWSYNDHWQNWLGNEYYVRSQESYDANPTEVVDREAELCRR